MHSKCFAALVVTTLLVPSSVLAAGGGGPVGGGGAASSVSPSAVAPVMISGLVATAFEGATGTVYTAQARSQPGFTMTYSIAGTDGGRFNINASTGAVSFKAAPRFTSPADADADNEYLVTVSASNGTKTSSLRVSIQVVQHIAARSYSWSNATWGDGGYASGLIYHPTVRDLLYARTDVGGAYRWNAASQTWTPLNDDLGKNADKDDSQLAGVLSLALDSHDGNKVYLATGMYLPSWGRTAAILRSADQGATWSRTELPIRLGGNDDGRNTGERLVVDPNKGSILFLGSSQDGLWKSIDSGVTWTQVTTFTTTATTTFVLFDGRFAARGHASQVIYVGVATTSGPSLYRSRDGGLTWAPVAGEPTGLMPLRGEIDKTGNLYLSYANAFGPNGMTNGSVWRLNTGGDIWTNVTPSAPTSSVTFGYAGVSVDAQHPGTVVVSTLDRWDPGDTIYRSTDSGATWTDLKPISTHAAPNNPWVAAYYGGSIGSNMGHWISSVEIDPFNSANVVYDTGYGIWMSNNASSSQINWDFNDAGFEETAITDLTSTNAGAHVLMTQGDVAGARYTSLTTSDVHGFFRDPNKTNDAVAVAERSPNNVVRTTDDKAIGAYVSGDNGVTWSHVGSTPVTSGNGPGRIAISAKAASMIWVPKNQGAYYSSNNGASWKAASGYPAVVNGHYFAPVADRAVDGYYYTYDCKTGTLYQSSDGGKTFAANLKGLPVEKGGAMISMPGINRRDLWIATTQGLYHINGAGASAAAVSSVQEAYLIAYGAPAPGKNYYALYLWGKVGGVVGIYRSDDESMTWTRVNDGQHQFGYINAMSGDPRVYGRVYVATGGRGVIIGNR